MQNFGSLSHLQALMNAELLKVSQRNTAGIRAVTILSFCLGHQVTITNYRALSSKSSSTYLLINRLV